MGSRRGSFVKTEKVKDIKLLDQQRRQAKEDKKIARYDFEKHKTLTTNLAILRLALPILLDKKTAQIK